MVVIGVREPGRNGALMARTATRTPTITSSRSPSTPPQVASRIPFASSAERRVRPWAAARRSTDSIGIGRPVGREEGADVAERLQPVPRAARGAVALGAVVAEGDQPGLLLEEHGGHVLQQGADPRMGGVLALDLVLGPSGER